MCNVTFEWDVAMYFLDVMCVMYFMDVQFAMDIVDGIWVKYF